MQALEFARTFATIKQELRIDDLVNLLSVFISQNPQGAPITEGQKNTLSQLLFDSRSAYDRLLKLPNAQKILRTTGIQEFYEPSRLRTILYASSGVANAQQVVQNYQLFTVISSLFEQLRAFQKMETTTRLLLLDEKIGAIAAEDAVLELELIEYADETGISPQRMQVFISSITLLYKNLTMVHGIKSDRLVFKYFDSGSSFLVGIQGVKAAMVSLDLLLNQWWERVRFWNYDTYDKKIESLSKTLTIVGEIQASVKKGTITAEEGEILKVGIFREADKLTGIGATVPLRDSASVDQRQLLTQMRNTKLLTDGTIPEPD